MSLEDVLGGGELNAPRVEGLLGSAGGGRGAQLSAVGRASLIRLLDDKAESLAKQGLYREQIDRLVDALESAQVVLPRDDPKLMFRADTLLSLCNLYASHYTQIGDIPTSVHLLRLTERLTEPKLFPKLPRRLQHRAQGYHAWAIACRRQGKIDQAVAHCSRAIEIESDCKGGDFPAGTHMTMGALMMRQGKHKAAFERTKVALHAMMVEQQRLESEMGLNSEFDPLRSRSHLREMVEQQPSMKNLLVSMCVAMHNCAVSLEFMYQPHEARGYHKRAYRTALAGLGDFHVLTERLEVCFREASDAKYRAREASAIHGPLTRDEEIEILLEGLPTLRRRGVLLKKKEAKERATGQSIPWWIRRQMAAEGNAAQASVDENGNITVRLPDPDKQGNQQNQQNQHHNQQGPRSSAGGSRRASTASSIAKSGSLTKTTLEVPGAAGSAAAVSRESSRQSIHDAMAMASVRRSSSISSANNKDATETLPPIQVGLPGSKPVVGSATAGRATSMQFSVPLPSGDEGQSGAEQDPNDEEEPPRSGFIPREFFGALPPGMVAGDLRPGGNNRKRGKGRNGRRSAPRQRTNANSPTARPSSAGDITTATVRGTGDEDMASPRRTGSSALDSWGLDMYNLDDVEAGKRDGEDDNDDDAGANSNNNNNKGNGSAHSSRADLTKLAKRQDGGSLDAFRRGSDDYGHSDSDGTYDGTARGLEGFLAADGVNSAATYRAMRTLGADWPTDSRVDVTQIFEHFYRDQVRTKNGIGTVTKKKQKKARPGSAGGALDPYGVPADPRDNTGRPTTAGSLRVERQSKNPRWSASTRRSDPDGSYADGGYDDDSDSQGSDTSWVTLHHGIYDPIYNAEGLDVRNIVPSRDAALAVITATMQRRRELRLPSSFYTERMHAATTIQKLFRGYRVRRLLASRSSFGESLTRRSAMRQSFGLLRLDKAARTIQRAHWRWRAATRGRRERERACTVLSAAWRGHVGRRYVASLHASSIAVQRRWRGKVSRRRTRLIIWSAHVLTHVAKRYVDRRRAERIHNAAGAIQAVARGVAVRNWLGRRTRAVVLLQRLVRGRLVRGGIASLHAAAVVIQRGVRYIWRRRKLLAYHLAQVQIARVVRGYRARKEVRRFRWGVAVVQALWIGRADRSRYKGFLAIVVRLQYTWRRSVARKRARQREAATRVIQVAWRGFVARLRLWRQQRGATRIQAVFRGAVVRSLHKRRVPSAIVIQRAYRAHRHRLHVTKPTPPAGPFVCLLAPLCAYCSAAVTIQKNVRLWLTVRWLRQRQWKAFLIQRRARRYLEMQRLEDKGRSILPSILALQAAHRGGVCRESLVAIDRAAHVIEWHRRQVLDARRQYRFARLKKITYERPPTIPSPPMTHSKLVKGWKPPPPKPQPERRVSHASVQPDGRGDEGGVENEAEAERDEDRDGDDENAVQDGESGAENNTGGVAAASTGDTTTTTTGAEPMDDTKSTGQRPAEKGSVGLVAIPEEDDGGDGDGDGEERVPASAERGTREDTATATAPHSGPQPSRASSRRTSLTVDLPAPGGAASTSPAGSRRSSLAGPLPTRGEARRMSTVGTAEDGHVPTTAARRMSTAPGHEDPPVRVSPFSQGHPSVGVAKGFHELTAGTDGSVRHVYSDPDALVAAVRIDGVWYEWSPDFWGEVRPCDPEESRALSLAPPPGVYPADHGLYLFTPTEGHCAADAGAPEGAPDVGPVYVNVYEGSDTAVYAAADGDWHPVPSHWQGTYEPSDGVEEEEEEEREETGQEDAAGVGVGGGGGGEVQTFAEGEGGYAQRGVATVEEAVNRTVDGVMATFDARVVRDMWIAGIVDGIVWNAASGKSGGDPGADDATTDVPIVGPTDVVDGQFTGASDAAATEGVKEDNDEKVEADERGADHKEVDAGQDSKVGADDTDAQGDGRVEEEENKVEADVGPETLPEPEAMAETVTSPKADAESERETEEEPKVDADPEANAEAEPETEDPEAEPDTVVEAEPKVEADIDPKADTEPETKAVAEPETKVEVEPETKVEVEPETKAVSEPETKAEAEPEPKAVAEPETKAEADTDTDPNTVADIDPKVEADTDPKVEADTDPKDATVPETKTEALATDPDTDHKVDAEPVLADTTEAKPDPEPTAEPNAESKDDSETPKAPVEEDTNDPSTIADPKAEPGTDLETNTSHDTPTAEPPIETTTVKEPVPRVESPKPEPDQPEPAPTAAAGDVGVDGGDSDAKNDTHPPVPVVTLPSGHTDSGDAVLDDLADEGVETIVYEDSEGESYFVTERGTGEWHFTPLGGSEWSPVPKGWQGHGTWTTEDGDPINPPNAFGDGDGDNGGNGNVDNGDDDRETPADDIDQDAIDDQADPPADQADPTTDKDQQVGHQEDEPHETQEDEPQPDAEEAVGDSAAAVEESMESTENETVLYTSSDGTQYYVAEFEGVLMHCVVGGQEWKAFPEEFGTDGGRWTNVDETREVAPRQA